MKLPSRGGPPAEGNRTRREDHSRVANLSNHQTASLCFGLPSARAADYPTSTSCIRNWIGQPPKTRPTDRNWMSNNWWVGFSAYCIFHLATVLGREDNCALWRIVLEI